MRGGAAIYPYNKDTVLTVYKPDRHPQMRTVPQVFLPPERQPFIATENPTQITFDSVLEDLGFTEESIEDFAEVADDLVDTRELKERYLEIANDEPYNLNWTTIDMARNADFDTGIENPEGGTYTKADIASDTIGSFYAVITGRGGRRNRPIKSKITKSKRTKSKRTKSKKNRSRRNRTKRQNIRRKTTRNQKGSK